MKYKKVNDIIILNSDLVRGQLESQQQFEKKFPYSCIIKITKRSLIFFHFLEPFVARFFYPEILPFEAGGKMAKGKGDTAQNVFLQKSIIVEMLRFAILFS